MARKGAPTWDDYPAQKNEDGHWLCRYCKKVLSGRRTAWCDKVCLRAVKLLVDWSTIRRQILRRDKWRCVLCTANADDVDHIIELADGGHFSDPSNLRSLCNVCHIKKTVQQRKIRTGRKKEYSIMEKRGITI